MRGQQVHHGIEDQATGLLYKETGRRPHAGAPPTTVGHKDQSPLRPLGRGRLLAQLEGP